MEDVLARTWTEIRWEEDEQHRRRPRQNDMQYDDRRPKRPCPAPDRRGTRRTFEPYSSEPRRAPLRNNRRPLNRSISQPGDSTASQGDHPKIP